MLLSPLVSCRRDRVFTRMSDSTFVHVMRGLRQLPVGAVDQTQRNQSRDSILAKYNVTGADVESTAVRLAGDPELAAEIWRAIEADVFTPP